MVIAVIGGRLQGVEAVYLAKKAGWKTLVIDKNPDVPAAGLCDRFLKFDFTFEHPVPEHCPEVDFILPAVEDINVIRAVKIWADRQKIPMGFDLDAYQISSSKLKSDLLFRAMNLSVPEKWPDCGFPVVVKPDEDSGSRGVEVFFDESNFFSRFSQKKMPDELVAQEYIKGQCFSIEVIGWPGNYQALQVTDLYMDNTYDCKRVAAPTQLLPHQAAELRKTGIAIAERINLKGIMDLEVVLNNNQLKIVEIDARFPSQTPMAVFNSTGINMVEMLASMFVNNKFSDDQKRSEKFVVVEHIRVAGSKFAVKGEHVMAGSTFLKLKPVFFGADEGLTDFVPGKKIWSATMIFSSTTREGLKEKQKKTYKKLDEFLKQGKGENRA